MKRKNKPTGCKLCRRGPCPIHSFYEWRKLPMGIPVIPVSPLKDWWNVSKAAPKDKGK